MRAETDVVVAGLGVLGAAATDALVRRGLRVVALDRHSPPHTLGSSHGETRIIRRVYSEGALHVPLVDRAYRLWQRLERESGRSLLLRRGGLFLGLRESELVRGALGCAEELRLEHELLDSEQLRLRHALRPPRRVVAVFDPAAGVLLAEPCLEALLSSAARAGADLRTGCGLEGWRKTGERFEVETTAGRLRARYLVLATGAWLAAAELPRALEPAVERQAQHWFEPAVDGERCGDLPPLVWELGDGRTWYALPDLGAGLKAGLHRGGAPTSADGVERRVTAAETVEVAELVRRYLPPAAGRCDRSEVCLYANTPDLRFLAGPLPGEPRVWLLGGGSGHAFKFAPALGELLATGVAEERPPAGLAPFLPARLV